VAENLLDISAVKKKQWGNREKRVEKVILLLDIYCFALLRCAGRPRGQSAWLGGLTVYTVSPYGVNRRAKSR